VHLLGAPVLSIGGAGTFDGIFVTALLAVLLDALSTPIAVTMVPSKANAVAIRVRNFMSQISGVPLSR
jgi:hypothetical protein